MRQEISQIIASVCKELFQQDVTVELTRPDEQFGDFATNIALQLSKHLGRPPREIAEQIAAAIHDDQIEKATVAGPGFINLRLTDQAIIALSLETSAQPYAGQTVVVEYSDPNPFKVLHAGHLYTSVVGDAIANLMETGGAAVHRVNFGGDVGLHVAKTMYVILSRLGGENPEGLADIAEDQRSEWLASAYIEGTNLYDENEAAKTEIMELNKRIYALHNKKDHDSGLSKIYWTTRQWSYDYFDDFYDRIGSRFEKYYPESETAGIGLKAVRDNVGKVFQESDGAIVFRGEDYDLHTRVFINREGLPTYEAKDVGLIMKKYEDYHFDRSIVITGNEQEQYMAVVLKAIEQFAPELARATTHLTHGMVKLIGGVKMSSRKGNILRAVDVLDAAQEANRTLNDGSDEGSALAAVKYAFLKNRMGGDIMYSPAESVALEGNSGPYLQYAHARARSILEKLSVIEDSLTELQPAERTLMRKVGEYAEVVDAAVVNLAPQTICSYLYELAQTFNRFYEHNRVLGDPRESVRIRLVTSYADTLRAGLSILGIAAPDKM